VDLTEKAKQVRRNIIKIANLSKSAHVGSSLSTVEILTTLYFKILNLTPWEQRDIFILSKGHAAMALYSTLEVKGIITAEQLEGYYLNDGTLPAHLDKFTAKGIEVSAGSLGHGFNMGIGYAFGFKKQGISRQVYALIGDGESQEGSIWEGALFAPRFCLDNFTAILDFNNLQGYGRACELCSYEPIREKWESFGWHVLEVDGHDIEELIAAFNKKPKGKPKIIIARTTKGKGISYMEDELIWHYYVVTDELKKQAMEELA